MKRRAWCVALAAFSFSATAWQPTARAQEQVQATAQATPPDIVKLKNGSLYRGTVMELVAGDHVDIRVPSGETKRFPMSDVEYAGPASGAPTPEPPQPAPSPEPAPAAPRPLVTVEANEARVHLVATTPDTDFHIRTADATAVGWTGRGMYTAVARGYTHICAAPCNATLPAGKQRLALSQGGKSPVEPDEPVTIPEAATVRGTYVSYAGTRALGIGIMIASVAAGAIMVAAAFHTKQDCSLQSVTGMCTNTPDIDTGLVFGGLAVAVLGPLVGLPFLLQHDRAEITVEPLDSAALKTPLMARREGAWLSSSQAAPAAGLALQVRF
jgi:hypothetical protein